MLMCVNAWAYVLGVGCLSVAFHIAGALGGRRSFCCSGGRCLVYAASTATGGYRAKALPALALRCAEPGMPTVSPVGCNTTALTVTGAVCSERAVVLLLDQQGGCFKLPI